MKYYNLNPNLYDGFQFQIPLEYPVRRELAQWVSEDRNNPVLALVIEDLDYANSLEFRGWTKVDYPYGYDSRHQANDIELWTKENLGVYWRMGRTYYFKDAADASVFLLKYT